MKRRTLLLLAIAGLIIFQAAKHKDPGKIGMDIYAYEEPVQLDLKVPDEVVSHSSPYHEAVSGTGLSIIRPIGFDEKLNHHSYYNGIDTTIDIYEDDHSGLEAKKRYADARIEAISHDRSLHERLKYRKDFKFNGYDAFVVCVSDTTSTRTAIYMAFGDEHFSVAMTGKMTEYSEAASTEIMHTMLTACYQKV